MKTKLSLKLKTIFFAVVILISFGLAKSSMAATINVTCSGDITTALTTATAASSDGDIVNISAGTCTTNPTWDNRIGWKNKNIIFQGQGHGTCTGNTCTCNPAIDTCFTVPSQGFMDAIEAIPGNNKMAWRMTNIFLTSSSGGGFTIDNSGYDFGSPSPATDYGWRVDHMTFYLPDTCGPHAMTILGLTYGLIDHNYFVMNCESTIDIDSSYASEDGTIGNLKGAYNMSLPFQPGSLNAVYIEDNTFIASASASAVGFAAIDSGYTGERVVFRHNMLTNVGLYSHWTSAGNVNALWWEIYNNKFVYTWTGQDFLTPMRLQGGGTGLIYNNTFVGWPFDAIRLGEGRLLEEGQSDSPLLYCDDTGGHSWDGNAGDPNAPGWPCLSQTGRAAGKTMAQIQAGDKQTSFPLYIWNNGPQDKCYNSGASGSACDNSFGVTIYDGSNYFKSTPHITSGFGNGDVDYCINTSKPSGCGTHTLTYTPLAYPHPLQGTSDTTPPAAPSGLSVL